MASCDTVQRPDTLDAFPGELKGRPVWVGWRYETRKGDTRPTKVPYRVHDTQRKADSTDPETWAPFDLAHARAACFDGIGFCTEGDVTCIDFDECLNAETGVIDPEVLA